MWCAKENKIQLCRDMTNNTGAVSHSNITPKSSKNQQENNGSPPQNNHKPT